MTAVGSVAVIGGGMAGLSVAILLAEGGVAVDVVEVAAQIGALGSGITLQGNALRVLRRVGIWAGVEAHGYAFESIGMRTADGKLLAEIPDSRLGGDDLPATVGAYRPDVARMLVERAEAVGVKVHCGVSPTSIEQDDDGALLTLSDGSSRRYDLVIGADGVRSWTRRAIGIDIETEALGMGIWRASTARPASVTRTDLCYDGPAYIAGFCPTGEDSIYAYLVEDAQDRSAMSPDDRLATMRGLAGGYHGPWDEIRANLTDPGGINYTLFEWHLIDGPWHRGRVGLIGDAAHCCPPTFAQGAAQALEDALVLAELLTGRDRLDDALWAEFSARRLPRAGAVVHASVQMCRWLKAGEQAGVPALMGQVRSLLVEQP